MTESKVLRGIEYANDGFYAGPVAPFAGVSTSIKVTDVTWKRLEPFSNGAFFFGWLDTVINAWRAIGYTDVGIVFRSQHSVLTKPTVDYPSMNLGLATGTQSAPPISLDRYRNVLIALVKRYRGKIQWIEPESEPQDLAHFLGTADDMLAMMRVVREVVDKYAPEIKVIMPGFCFGDLFDDNPSASVAEARWEGMSEPLKTYYANARSFLTKQLRDGLGMVNAIEYHSNADAAGIVPAIDYAKSIVPNATVPWWIGDATSAPILTYADGRTWNPWLPVDQMNRLLLSLATPSGSTYAADFKFFHDAQTDLTRRKIVATAQAGCERIQLGMLNDWRVLGNLFYGALTGFGFQGLLNDNGTLRDAAKVIQGTI